MSVVIGSNQTLERNWLESYFPDDLPLEWRFEYYANDYPIVQFADSLWSSDICLTEFDWPDSLVTVFEISSKSLQCTDCLQQITQFHGIHDELLLMTDDEAVCRSMRKSGLPCLVSEKMGQGGYENLHSTQERPVIYSLHDKGEDLRQLRTQIEARHSEDQDSWIFLDSPPARLEQIKLMLDLMGIRA